MHQNQCACKMLYLIPLLAFPCTHIPLNNTPLTNHTTHMDPKPNIINLSSDSDESNHWVPFQPPTRPTKSPFLFTSDEESEEEKTHPAPTQAHSMPEEEPKWMSYFPPSTSMPFYDPGVPLGSYFPSMPAENEEEEEALEIPPLAIVYPDEEFPSEVGSSKKASSKKSKKAKPVKPPKTGRGKSKKRGD